MKIISDFRIAARRLSGWCSGMLMALLFVLSTFVQSASGQAAEYGLEEVKAGDAQDAAQMPAGGGVDSAPALMSGGISSIGSAQSGVRGAHGGGQSAMLRYDQHREIQPPEYATLRLGSLYSNIGISQSVGYRYTRLSGAGIDFLEGNRRGDIIKGGSEFPMVTGLTLDNYLIITRKMDLEANISINYLYFPMKTQENEFQVNLTDEGVFATFSTEFTPTRDTRVLVYDDILYRTDYVDTRGLSDRYGGQEYRHLANTIGVDWDWRPTELDSFSAAASRRDTIPLDKEFDLQESIIYSEMGSYRKSLTPFVAVGLLGTASQSFYDDADRPDVYINGISAFTGIRLAPRLTGDASLGYQISTTTGGLLNEDISKGSMTASLGLNHELSDTKRQRLSYQRTLTEAFYGGVDASDVVGYNLSWSGGLFPGGLSSSYAVFTPQDTARNGYQDWASSVNINHQLTRLINLGMFLTYDMRMNDTTETATDGSLPDLNSDYETLTFGVNTGLKVSRETTLSAYASHADRTSENPDLVYTRDTIGVTLAWAHKF